MPQKEKMQFTFFPGFFSFFFLHQPTTFAIQFANVFHQLKPMVFDIESTTGFLLCGLWLMCDIFQLIYKTSTIFYLEEDKEVLDN